MLNAHSLQYIACSPFYFASAVNSQCSMLMHAPLPILPLHSMLNAHSLQYIACSPFYFASAVNSQCSMLNAHALQYIACSPSILSPHSMLNANAHALQYIARPRLTNVCLIVDCTAYTAANEDYSSDC
jgi:hypothetical protein